MTGALDWCMAWLGPFLGQSVQERAGVSLRCDGEGVEVVEVAPPGVLLAQGGVEADTDQGGQHHLHPAPRGTRLYSHDPDLPPLPAPVLPPLTVNSASPYISREHYLVRGAFKLS